MKKVLILLAAFALSMNLLATNYVSIAWNADIHNGAAAGDPAGYIDGTGFLDTSGMSTGDMLALDVFFNNIDFVFAGFEFEFRYPPYLNLVSVVDGEWAAQTQPAAIFMPGTVAGPPPTGGLMLGAIQGLPADSTGQLVSGHNVSLIQEEGRVRIGYLWTVTTDRPPGAVGSEHAGGLLGTMYFQYNNNGCDSNRETSKLTLTATLTAEGDIFANDMAERVSVGTDDLTVDFGNPSALLRTDANGDGVRNSQDTVLAARGAFYGIGDASLVPYNWASRPAEFLQVFDGNCDGVVNSQDTVINARNAFYGTLNRTQFKKLDYFAVEKDGVFAVNSEGRHAAQAVVWFKYQDMTLGEPFIDDTAKKNGWILMTDKNSEYFGYAVVNFMLKDVEIPVVQFKFQATGENPSIAIATTEHQSLDLTEFFQYVPLVEVYGVSAEKPIK